MVRNDPLWKGIIQELAFPFLIFFFPDEKFDFNRAPQFLDKELEQIYPRSDINPKRRLVDKLMKVWTILGEDLKKMDNPFALVILTVLESIKMQNKSPEQQINIKLDLVRLLAKKNFDREYISTMMSFIRFYVTLPDEKMNLMFEKRVGELVANKNLPMGVEEILLQQAEEKGLEKGLKKGLRKGLAKGRKEERAKANQKLKEAVRNMLREGFDILFICKVLEVSEDVVREIQAENS